MVNILAGQTADVIGGTSGIGFSVAKHILETTQANVVVASSKQERVDKAIRGLTEISSSHRVRRYVLDVSIPRIYGLQSVRFSKRSGHLIISFRRLEMVSFS